MCVLHLILKLFIKYQEEMKQLQRSSLKEKAKAVLDIIESEAKDKLSHLNEESPIISKQPCLRILLKIGKIQGLIDQYKIEDIEEEIKSIIKQNSIDQQFSKSAWLKLYATVLASCIMEKNQVEGEHFLSKLLSLINSVKDVRQTLHFLFGITSLLALQRYKIDLNMEYKYDSGTQVLFFYFLSQIKEKEEKQLLKKCSTIIQRESQKQQVSNSSKLYRKIKDEIKNNKKDKFLSKVIKEMLKRQRQILKNGFRFPEQNVQLDIAIQSYLANKMPNKSKKQQNGKENTNYYLIKLLKSIQNYKQPIYYDGLLKTNFIRRLQMQDSKILLAESGRSQVRRYGQMLALRDKGDKDCYQICKQGTQLKKCNFNNQDSQMRFVYYDETGVYWGKNKEKCKLKYEWKQIRGVIYGSASQNLYENYKQVKNNCCFSLFMIERTIDFICKNAEEALTWVQGALYILNCFPNKSIPYSRGLALWTKIFIELKKQGQPWQLKGQGIAELQLQ